MPNRNLIRRGEVRYLLIRILGNQFPMVYRTILRVAVRLPSPARTM